MSKETEVHDHPEGAKRRINGPGRKNAILLATAVEVLCPACGESQPDPEKASFFWTVDQVRRAQGEKRTCTACDAPIRIVLSNHVKAE